MDDKLTEIKQREQAATPGPWEYVPEEDEALTAFPCDPNGFVREIPVITVGVEPKEQTNADKDFYFVEISEENAEFIAHAREDIPFLLSQLETLTARIAELEKERDAAVNIMPHICSTCADEKKKPIPRTCWTNCNLNETGDKPNWRLRGPQE